MQKVTNDPRFGKESFKLEAFKDDIEINKEDLARIFSDRRLLEDECFFIIDSNTHEITTEHGSDFREDAKKLKKAFNNGETIIVKRLHDLDPKISAIAKACCKNAISYMLVAPSGGESFSWHKDDRHVILRQVYGSKIIFYKDEDDQEKFFELNAGDWCSIPQGVLHKAINKGPSIILVIGVMENETWFVENSISLSDLQREYPGL